MRKNINLLLSKKLHIVIGILLYVILVLVSISILINYSFIVPGAYVEYSNNNIFSNYDFFSDGFIISRTLILIFILNSLLKIPFYLFNIK